MKSVQMYMVPPILISAGNLLSTNAPEPTPAWSQGTLYAVDAQVSYPGKLGLTHNWISLVSANAAVPGSDKLKWLDAGADNRHAMLDNYNSTQSMAAGTLQFVFKPGAVFTNVALFNITGAAARVEVLSPSGQVIYDVTKSLTKRQTSRWSEYFFAGFKGRLTQAFFVGIPFSTQATVRVTVSGPGTVGLGRVVCGRRQDLGELEFGVSPYLTDYSRKEWDKDFGDYEWTVRDYARGFSGSLWVKNPQLNRVWASIIGARSLPTLFVGSEDPNFSETLVTLGVLTEAKPSINYPTETVLNLTVEGLT
jgi:hypothetical protein